jgi:recombination protein RecR
VEETSDVIAIEKAGFDGVYYVLNRSFNFVGGDFLTRLDADDIVRRLSERGVREILVATNPDLDGEVVARMVAESGRQQGVVITRLAHGLPVGGDIEFADEITLRQAIKGRKEI